MSGKEREVVCPSGMRGMIRPLKVTEERLYREAKVIKANRTIQQFISHGWVGLVDPGPYNFKGDKVDWDKLLIGDSMYLLMQVRAATYTHEYPIVFPCQGCNKPVNHTIDVLQDMEMQLLPEESRVHVSTGDPMSIMYDNREIRFRLLTLGDEKQISRIEDMRKFNRVQAALAVRIVEVEGIDKHGFGVINWIEEMDASEPDDLTEILDEYDCGLDTTIDAICEHCKYRQELDLPLQASFFRKPSKRKERRRARAQVRLAEEM